LSENGQKENALSENGQKEKEEERKAG